MCANNIHTSMHDAGGRELNESKNSRIGSISAGYRAERVVGASTRAKSGICSICPTVFARQAETSIKTDRLGTFGAYCSSVARSVYFLDMWRTGKLGARIVATIFAVAMTYASYCATTCGLGVCPYQEQRSPAHDCDNPSHPSGPHHHGSGKSDCSAHYHPSVNFVKPYGLQQLVSTGKITVNGLIADVPGVSHVSLELSSFHVGSPPTPTSPLYQRISVLRI